MVISKRSRVRSPVLGQVFGRVSGRIVRAKPGLVLSLVVVLILVLIFVLGPVLGVASAGQAAGGVGQERRIGATLADEAEDHAAVRRALEARRRALAHRLASAEAADGLANDSRGEVLAEASRAVERAIVDELMPRWLGVRWGNGAANRGRAAAAAKPRDREIDCGSFVVAVLEEAGFRMAAGLERAPALRILESLAGDGEIARWQGTVPGLERELVRRGDGIYLLGLARHVGFAVVRGDRVRLVHASRGEGQVVDEAMASSRALLRSRGAPIFAAKLFSSSAPSTAVTRWLRGAVLGPQ